MFNIDAKLPQLAQDKANHVIYGAVLALVGGAVLPGVLGVSALVAAALTAGVVGAAKEVLDKYTGGDPTVQDFLATLAGGVLVGVATLL